MLTSYRITKQPSGFLLECTGGPCKLGHEHIATDGLSLEQTLATLGVPKVQRAEATRELRSSSEHHTNL